MFEHIPDNFSEIKSNYSNQNCCKTSPKLLFSVLSKHASVATNQNAAWKLTAEKMVICLTRRRVRTHENQCMGATFPRTCHKLRETKFCTKRGQTEDKHGAVGVKVCAFKYHIYQRLCCIKLTWLLLTTNMNCSCTNWSQTFCIILSIYCRNLLSNVGSVFRQVKSEFMTGLTSHSFITLIKKRLFQCISSTDFS